METKKKILEGAVTAAALALIFFTDWTATITAAKQHFFGQRPLEPAAAASSVVDRQKQAAVIAAKEAILDSLVHPKEVKWGAENETSFLPTATENFLALRADVLNGRGETVREHWIVRLEPGTNRVLGQVCREEAHAIGSLEK